MKESVAIAKEADAKKGVSPIKSDNSIHRVRDEPERQIGSLRGVIGNITRNGGKPSVENIATELSSMHTTQRAPALLALQQTHGNRYVQRVVAGIQAKLVVGQPGDIYEQEADRVADAVMRMPDPRVQRPAEPEEEEEEKIRTKQLPSQTLGIVPDVETSINSIRGGGQPLSESTRAFFERRFGIDFSQVRVHADSQAAQTASAVNARAFTFGWDIVFGAEQYEPSASEGRRLLAHELTHVVQQKSMLNNITNSPEAVQREDEDGNDITQTTISCDYAVSLNDQNLAEQIELLQDFIFLPGHEGEIMHERAQLHERAQFNLSILQAEHRRRRNIALTQRYIGFEDTADFNDEDFTEQIQFLEDVIASMSEEECTPEPEEGESLRFAQFNLAFLQAELRRRRVRETDWRARVRDPDVGLYDRMLYVMELLVDLYRFSVEGAAGLVGNLSRESRVVPNMNELGGRQGRGIVQWTEAGRRQGLFQHEFRGRRLGQAILFDLDAQVDYMVTELQGIFPELNSYLRSDAAEVAGATRRVFIEYENSQIVVDWRNARRALEDAQSESDRAALQGEVARTERRVDAAAGARRIQAIRARELYRREQLRLPFW